MKLFGIAAIILSLVVAWYIMVYIPGQDKAKQTVQQMQYIEQSMAKDAQRQKLQDCLKQADTKFQDYFQANSYPNPQPSQPDTRTWNSWQLEQDAIQQQNDDKTLCLKLYPQQ